MRGWRADALPEVPRPRGAAPEGGLLVDLRAADFAGGPVWPNRAPGGQPDAVVPLGVKFDGDDGAFVFPGGGELISVPVATSLLPEATFAVWVKVEEPLPSSNLGWVMAQAPDYTWSRALVLNDFRLGHVSMTTSRYWNSELGKAPLGSWCHLVGAWRQDGSCTPFLNGVAGATAAEAKSGRGSDPNERIVIGGRDNGDQCHNPAVRVADVRVYGRALAADEVTSLFRLGRSTGDGLRAAPPRAPAPAPAPQLPLESALAPRWDEDAELFWFPTGLLLRQLPDGLEWQRDFRAALEQASAAAQASGPPGAPARGSRTLRPHASDDQVRSPPGSSRQLCPSPSDPDKLLGRAAHAAALAQMSHGPGVVVKVHNQDVALFRFGERVHAVQAACPHQGGNLADGEVGDLEDMVDGRRCYVACPVHKFQFDLVTGAPLQGRKCPPLPVFAARVAAGGGAARAEDAGVDAGGPARAAADGAVEVGFSSLASNFFAPDGGEEF